MELDPQGSPEELLEQGGGAGLRKLDFFRFGLFFNSSATDTVLVTLPVLRQQLHSALVAAQWRGGRHRLNTSIVLAAVLGLSSLFREVSVVEPSLSRPLPPPPHPSPLTPLVPVPNKPPRFCGRKVRWSKSWTEEGVCA